MCTPADEEVHAHPGQFHVRMCLRTPIELEQERAGNIITSAHFGSQKFRILWGTESVPGDFSAAPAAIREMLVSDPDYVEGASVTIPKAYFGEVTAEGLVDCLVRIARSGATALQLGEHVRAEPDWASPIDWMFDHVNFRALDSKYFHKLVSIPLQTPTPEDGSETSRRHEIWWRLWNLGMIDEAPGGRGVESRNNERAKQRWNYVRSLLEGREADHTDSELLTDLQRYHERPYR